MNLKVPVAVSDHSQGPEDAPIILIEYGDYECPYCGRAFPEIKKVEKHFGSNLRFIFRNFPLREIHPYAEAAAEAAEFAATKGVFWEMHDNIYLNQRLLSIPTLIKLAEELNLSIADLERTIEKRAYESKIQKDFLGGIKSGVNGTPTFFINDQRYDGPPTFNSIVASIEANVK